jgi:glycerol-3-phosphate dehydrogenase
MKAFDIFIIGGGINGIAIANDAAGRQLKVGLCEKGDLANATSSASTKLIHGGLRYLEYYQFRLVKEALKEREILLNKAPHLISPLRFVMPYNRSLRSALAIKIGLFLYDHLSHRSILESSQMLGLAKHPAGQALLSSYQRGFLYSDCWADDARLVLANAIQAKEKGADIYTYTECIGAQRTFSGWNLELLNHLTQEKTQVHTKVLINAAGPWVESVIRHLLKIKSTQHIRMIKGSHIVVPKVNDTNYAYLLQNTDKRIVFVIPFLGEFSIIGTTDVEYTGNPKEAKISTVETSYLCDIANLYFQKKIKPEDVLWSYSGVRPLHYDEHDNPSAISRDYTFELNQDISSAPVLSIFGGKLTTHRKLAEHALDHLKAFLPPHGSPWTAETPLPGGEIAHQDFEKFSQQFLHDFPWLPEDLAHRYLKQYGSRVSVLLAAASCLEDLGHDFGQGLYQREVDYLIQYEWAKKAEDILWRRTKLGLFFQLDKKLEAVSTNLDEYLQKAKELHLPTQ